MRYPFDEEGAKGLRHGYSNIDSTPWPPDPSQAPQLSQLYWISAVAVRLHPERLASPELCSAAHEPHCSMSHQLLRGLYRMPYSLSQTALFGPLFYKASRRPIIG